MSLLLDIVAYIDTNTSRTSGVDLFGNVMPDLPIDCVACYEPSAMGPMEVYGAAAKPPVEMPRLQIIVRSTLWATGRETSRVLWELISAIVDQTIGSTYYQRIAAQDSVQFLGYDSNKNPTWSMNFQVWKDT